VIATASVARLIGLCAILSLALAVAAPDGWAQVAPPGQLQAPGPIRKDVTPEDEPVTQRQPLLLRLPSLGPTLAPDYPGLSSYPLEFLQLLMRPLEPRDLNLLPTFAISEGFSDNIFLNNNNKQYDFITSFTPGVMGLVNRPRFQLAAGFSNEAEIFARGTNPNDAFARQNLVIASIWEPTPTMTVTVADTFLRDQSPNATVGGFSILGQGGETNVFNPTFGWRIEPETRLDLGAAYSIVRFEGTGAGIASDTYTFNSNLTHAFTPRLSGMVGYNLTYIDFRTGHVDNATANNPTIGLSYRLTPTLSVGFDGGPVFTHLGNEDFVTPGISAGLSQQFSFGTLSAFYARSVGVAGGFGGPTDNQTVAATLVLPTWRDWIVIFNPNWTQSESLSSKQIQRVDVSVFTISIGAAYRVNPYVAVFGGYHFLLQQVGRFSTTPGAFDADENRFRFGVQFGYPFGFDLGG
jgi:hypothetical protein